MHLSVDPEGPSPAARGAERVRWEIVAVLRRSSARGGFSGALAQIDELRALDAAVLANPHEALMPEGAVSLPGPIDAPTAELPLQPTRRRLHDTVAHMSINSAQINDGPGSHGGSFLDGGQLLPTERPPRGDERVAGGYQCRRRPAFLLVARLGSSSGSPSTDGTVSGRTSSVAD